MARSTTPISSPHYTTSTTTLAMVLVNEKKFACATCIKGHRVSGCTHTDRPLFEVKKKGRPATQCQCCKDRRKASGTSGAVHTKVSPVLAFLVSHDVSARRRVLINSASAVIRSLLLSSCRPRAGCKLHHPVLELLHPNTRRLRHHYRQEMRMWTWQPERASLDHERHSQTD